MQTYGTRNKIWIGVVLALLIAIAYVFFAGVDPAVTAAPLKQENLCAMPFVSVSQPLTELGNSEYIRMDGQATGFTGGLYPDGSNQPPSEHLAAGLELASQIVPLDVAGNPDSQDGKIVLLSVGMSNTATEFGVFTSLSKDEPQINPQVVLFNGALSSATSDFWVDPQSVAWTELERKMDNSPFSHQQVQAAWIKLTQIQGGDFPAKAESLQADLEGIVRLMKTRFPNLQIVYLSSRTRSYTTWRGLSPEPVAFETGFAVKWLIEKQINNDPQLNYDPERGEVLAPYLTWGPYLWIDGLNPRADGQVWLAEDMKGDCTHPSDSGAAKIAAMLLDFFQSDPTAKPWFTGSGVVVAPAPTSTTVPTETQTESPTEAPTATALPTEGQPSATQTATASAGSTATQPPPVAEATVSQPTPSQEVEQVPPESRPSVAALWPWMVGGCIVGLLIAALLLLRSKPDR